MRIVRSAQFRRPGGDAAGLGTASGELLEQWGQVIDQACAGVDDPAEVFAVALRISGRLSWTHPDIARFLAGDVRGA